MSHITILDPMEVRNLSAERVLDALALVQKKRQADLAPAIHAESAKVLKVLAAEAALRGLFGELSARVRRKVGEVQAAAFA